MGFIWKGRVLESRTDCQMRMPVVCLLPTISTNHLEVEKMTVLNMCTEVEFRVC